MAPSVTGEGAESQVRVWPDKLSVCAPLLGRCGQEVGERCSSCTKDREQAAVLLCFWRTVRERSRCVCGGHQGMKDVILRVRGRPGGDMLVVPPSEDRWIVMAGLAGRIRAGQVSSSERSAGNEPTLPPDSTTRPRCPRMRIEMDVDGPRPVARLGIGFAESHAAPHERALGRLLSAGSSAQHPPARSSKSPFLYDISQRSETRASPYNTLTQREGAPVPASLYSLFFLLSSARPRAVSIIYQVTMDHLFIEQAPRGM